MLLIIIFASIALGLTIISILLVLFVRKALHNNNGKLARLIAGLLVLQFVLGMLSNLFVQIPTVQPWRIFHYVGPVVLHSVNALFLLIFSVLFLINACKTGRMKAAAIIGFTAIICAFASGIIFVNLGLNNVFSFSMSLSFIVAFIVYLYAAFDAIRSTSQQ